MYQPAAYAAVRQFTTPKTAGMGYAMLYALMNLGGWLPTFFTPIRKAIGISGAYWVYVGFTVLGLILLAAILSRKTVERAIAEARAASRQDREKPADKAAEAQGAVLDPGVAQEPPAGRPEVRLLHLRADPGADAVRPQLADAADVRGAGLPRHVDRRPLRGGDQLQPDPDLHPRADRRGAHAEAEGLQHDDRRHRGHGRADVPARASARPSGRCSATWS